MLNLNNAKLEAVAASLSQYPKNQLPEIVLLGRSNVGKSSLINTILNRKNLARTSSSPGKTATINFYNIDDKIRLVDLPGYGYAKRTEAEKEKWAKMIEDYICKGNYIHAFFQLIDIRHLPTNNDKIMYEWVKSRNLPQVIIFTKSDKISKTAAKNNIEAAVNKFNFTGQTIAFSAKNKQGKDEIIKLLEDIAK